MFSRESRVIGGRKRGQAVDEKEVGVVEERHEVELKCSGRIGCLVRLFSRAESEMWQEWYNEDLVLWQTLVIEYYYFAFSVATAEDSPVAMKMKKMWLKTPVSEEQAAQAVLDPAIGA